MAPPIPGPPPRTSRHPHRAYTIGWLAWIAWFFIEEQHALEHGTTADTLSGHVWHWFGTDTTAPGKGTLRLRRIALISFMAWLTVHFVAGGREV